MASVNQLNLTANAGGAATARVQVTNVGSRPQVVQAAVRSTTKTLATVSKAVPFDRDSLPTFVDAFGTTRTFTKTTFTVPKGGDHLSASIAWPGNGTFTVRLVLLDPNGVYTAYSLPQGAGSGFAVVDVPQPKAGTWTAVLFSSAAPVGFTGTVRFGATTFQNVANGGGSPRQQVDPGRGDPHGDGPGAGTEEGQRHQRRADADRLRADHGRADHAAHAGAAGPARRLVLGHLHRRQRPRRHPEPGDLVRLRPSSTAPRPCRVGFTVNGDTNQQLYGFLIDPNGEPVSEKTNLRADGSLVGSLQFSTINPQAGPVARSPSRCSGRCPARRWRRRSAGRSRSTRPR